MNFIAFLILIAVGGGAFYEYTVQRQTAEGIATQTAALSSQLQTLETESHQLQDTKSSLLKQVTAAETQVTALTERLQQLQAQQKQMAKVAAPPPPSLSEYANAPAPIGTPLGTIVTITGQNFQNCKLLKIEPDGVTFSHSQGITKILYPDLAPADQKRFGYDPSNSAALEDARLRYQEQLREAAAAAAAGQAPAQ